MLAGYSGTPLLKKLGVKPGSALRLYDAPNGFAEWAAAQVEFDHWAESSESADVAVLFCEWESRLTELLLTAVPELKINGGLWIAWPKKASKVPTDLTEDRLRDLILPMGLVDNKVCAIDEKWSGLRFVWRLEKRENAALKR